MTDAIEAGARALIQRRKAIFEDELDYPTFEEQSKIVIEAAIASGALVPASAVAEMRERCAQAGWKAAYDSGQIRRHTDTPDEVANAIRQLDIVPASGDYVVVPREPTQSMRIAGAEWRECKGDESESLDDIDRFVATRVYKAMLNAASRTGGEK